MGAGFAGSVVLGGYVGPAMAVDTVQRVIQANLQDGNRPSGDPEDTSWYREDTRVGGGVTLTKDFGGPPGFGDGSVALTTNDQANAKAQLYTNQVNGTPLADITELSYWTYQDSDAATTFPGAAVAYQLQIDFNGPNSSGGFATLTYEPYLNPLEQAVLPDVWQFWDATNGNWYSSRSFTCGTLVVTASSGAPPFVNPTQVGTACGATVLGLGINIGTSNPNYITAADGVRFETLTDSFTADFGPK